VKAVHQRLPQGGIARVAENFDFELLLRTYRRQEDDERLASEVREASPELVRSMTIRVGALHP